MDHAGSPACARLARLFGRALQGALLVASMLAVTAADSAPAEHPQGRSVQAKKDKPPGKGRKEKRPAASKATKGGAADRAIEPPISTPQPPIRIGLSIQRASLENGLRVVLNPDHAVPVVAVAVVYGAGSRAEEKDRAGLSHLVEHLMFQGSANVSQGEHAALVSDRGGMVFSSASPDRTGYVQVMPASELELALWLEADRMKSLRIAPEAFESHRKAAGEKYRGRIFQTAYGLSGVRLEELVFQGYWPYEHEGLTTANGLDQAKLEWAEAFYARHYAPGNAVVSIAGDFDPATAMALVHRCFGGVHRPYRAPPELGSPPEQTSQRTAVLRDARAHTPHVLYGFAIPKAQHADHHALELAARILGDGESSRLYQALVRRDALAESISARTGGRCGPDLFFIQAKLTATSQMGDVEKIIEGEIKSLATHGPTETETEKARRRAQMAFLTELQSNQGRALRLGELELFAGDARTITAEIPGVFAVTAADIKRATAEYLGPLRRTIVETYPPDPPQGAEAPKPPAAPGKAPPPGANPKAPAARPKAQPKGQKK